MDYSINLLIVATRNEMIFKQDFDLSSKELMTILILTGLEHQQIKNH